MKQEFNLSDYVWDECDDSCIKLDYVKEFIKRLKEELNRKSTYTMGWNEEQKKAYSKGLNDCKEYLLEEIDKLAGDELR